MRYYLCSALLLLFWTTMLVSAAPPTTAYSITVTPTKLAMIPESVIERVAVSADGAAFACPVPEGTKWRVVSTDFYGKTKSEPLVDEVCPGRLWLDFTGSQLAYVAMSAGQWGVVFNGVPGMAFDEIGDWLKFFGGPSIAYLARSGNKWFLVTQEARTPRPRFSAGFDAIRAEGFAQTKKFPSVAFIVRNGNQWGVTYAGTVAQWYDDVRDLSFAPDDKRMVYAAKIGSKWCLGGITRPTMPLKMYDALGAPIYSPDSSRIVYPASLNGKWSLMVYGPPPFKPNGPEFLPKFGPDGKQFGTVRNAPDMKDWPVETALSQPYDAVGTPLFSHDGAHLAYPVQQNGKWSVVLDGQLGAPYDEVVTPCLSADGQHLVYAARTGAQWCVVVDGKAGAGYDAVGTLVVTPSGKHVAYPARVGTQWCVVRDGAAGKLYDEVGPPVFTPQEKHLAYPARTGETWRVVCDGQEGPTCHAIIGKALSPLCDYEPPRPVAIGGTVYTPTVYKYLAVHETTKTFPNGQKALELSKVTLMAAGEYDGR